MVPLKDNAEKAIKALIDDAKAFLLSPKEAGDRLSEIARIALDQKVRLVITQFGEAYTWGDTDSELGETLLSEKISDLVSYDIQAERWPKTAAEQQFLQRLSELAKALWGDDLRQMGGVAWKRESVRAKLASSIDRLTQTEGPRSLAILYGDLDHFKQLNDQAGHDEGDVAIRYVNRALHDMCLQNGGLPFHPSGDEYYILLPAEDLLDTLKALRLLREEIRNRPFGASQCDSPIFIDLTLGMHIVAGPVSYESVEEALRNAEDATKKLDERRGERVKKRGKLSIYDVEDVEGNAVSPDVLAQLGAVIIRRRIEQKSSFLDTRLGLIALIAEECVASDHSDRLEAEVREVMNWLDVQPTEECLAESLLQMPPPLKVPELAVGLAVSAGVLKALSAIDNDVPDLHICFSELGGSVAVELTERCIWGDSSPDSRSVMISGRALQDSGGCLIGVKVGFDERLKIEGTDLDFPTDVLERVVQVDDRPATGGGLPDFWQVAIAQIAEIAIKVSGDLFVLIWGANAKSTETYLRLTGEKHWEEDPVARLVGAPSQRVREVRDTLQNRTKFVSSTQEMLDATYKSATVKSFQHLLEHRPDDEISLHRSVMEVGQLERRDGFRCRDAAQAYPLAIDVLRKEISRQSLDDAGQELVEALSFKLVLDTPSRNKFPTYLTSQEEEANEYSRRVLLDPDGMIRKGWEKGGQVAAFLEQLKRCFAKGGVTKSTRRACLIASNKVEDELLSPPGIISVWASPRVGQTERHLVDFIFVWRTVEAFVGLPYSLFGSIRLAEELLKDLKKTVDWHAPPQGLQLGELTYVALSLHMRVDGLHKRIAKEIVDESSD